MKRKIKPKALGAENVASQATAEATQLDPFAVVSIWLDLQENHVRQRKALFVDWLTKQGFTTSPTLEGSYKKVYVHPATNYVVKVSKKGTGNTIPKKKEVRNLFLLPIYTDRHVMVQPKAQTSPDDQSRACSKLHKIIENENLGSYFKDRDFAPCNCGLFEGRPYIIDLSHRRGFTIEFTA
jgi:hypothetical protein